MSPRKRDTVGVSSKHRLSDLNKQTKRFRMNSTYHKMISKLSLLLYILVKGFRGRVCLFLIQMEPSTTPELGWQRITWAEPDTWLLHLYIGTKRKGFRPPVPG